MIPTTEGSGRPIAVARSLRAVGTAILVGVGVVRRYLAAVLGEDAYRVYCEHHRANHPDGEAVLTEREFWRMRMDEADRNPGARCC